ncbi:tigger transposable element-derived protein 6 [Elysia marginata]|uniref:Tigger transposable element-derived protein 6 n=1 Tax=Elysia marginata TaxID=1093978 RepID=A0AAV4H530_9GAST|nr:tigger transposable element-derived protein 6 [Elysia marginata]
MLLPDWLLSCEDKREGDGAEVLASLALRPTLAAQPVKLQKAEGSIDSGSFGYGSVKRRVFTDDQEKMILDYVLEASSIYYGLTLEDMRTIAFEVAEKNSIPENPIRLNLL